jgi:hypothetical protein
VEAIDLFAGFKYNEAIIILSHPFWDFFKKFGNIGTIQPFSCHIQ